MNKYNTKIAFSQVREDPELDLLVLRSNEKENKKVLIIGSGGCSVLTLLLDPQVSEIHVVDPNIEQIELLKLKISMLEKFKNASEYLAFFESEDIDFIEKSISEANAQSQFTENYLKSQKETNFSRNINQNGVFEELFKELREEFTINPMDTFNKEEWEKAFKKVFDREHLIEAFGEEAVKYSMSQEFSEHFSRVMYQAIIKYKGKDNYFLDQIFKGKYEKDIPVYLSDINKGIISKRLDKIHFINSSLQDYIANTEEKYDFVHTSNITDWLPLEKLDGLYSDIYQLLNSKGKVISRRLNGDHSLIDIVSDRFKTGTSLINNKNNPYFTRFKSNEYINLKENDKSFFYNEVFFGEKE